MHSDNENISLDDPYTLSVLAKWQHKSPERIWYSPKTLALTIAQFPLTMERVRAVLEKSLVSFDDDGSYCRHHYSIPGYWDICIEEPLPPEQQAEDLLHEIAHIYYREDGGRRHDLRGRLTTAGKLEALLDQEASRCYKTYTVAMDTLLVTLKAREII